MLIFEGVSAAYSDGTQALAGVSLHVRAGEVCAVLGPNGAGKSTLVRLLSGLLAPSAGRILVNGRDLKDVDRRDAARLIAVVPQHTEVAMGFRVGDVVAMGRAPHQGAWMRSRPEDETAVARALSACELGALRHRPVAHLSGGEQKRVAIARALAQEAPVLVLDEAASSLDVRHALDLYEVICAEVVQRGAACLMIVHDLNAAARYADRVALMKEGHLVAAGTVEEVMTYRRLKEVFEAELFVGVNELDQKRYFLPVRRGTTGEGSGGGGASAETGSLQSRRNESSDL